MIAALAWSGGAIAWSLQLVLSYAIVALACSPDPALAGSVRILGGSTLLLTLIAVVAAMAASVAAVACFAGWRARRGPRGDDAAGAADRPGLALVGLALNLLFVAVIVLGASAPFVLPTC